MKNLLLILLVLVFAACSELKQTLVGNDRDEHNCIASAGYTWSEVRQACVRLWEEGFALFNVQEENPSLAAYGVMGNDFKEIELFLPDQEGSVLLTREGQIWSDTDNLWRLVRHPSQVGQQEEWELFENSQLRFNASPILTQPLD